MIPAAWTAADTIHSPRLTANRLKGSGGVVVFYYMAVILTARLFVKKRRECFLADALFLPGVKMSLFILWECLNSVLTLAVGGRSCIGLWALEEIRKKGRGGAGKTDKDQGEEVSTHSRHFERRIKATSVPIWMCTSRGDSLHYTSRS